MLIYSFYVFNVLGFSHTQCHDKNERLSCKPKSVDKYIKHGSVLNFAYCLTIL